MQNNQKLNTLSLTLLITGAIDSIRNLPATALLGSHLIFFFILAALVFLIPTALVSAELTANVDEGGIYQWARLAFGEHIGFLAIWLQWINNVVWFPTILSFIAGTAAYLISPSLADNKVYMITMMLSLFWLITFINLKGIRLSSKFTSFAAMVGLILPMSLIISLMAIWIFKGYPIRIDFSTTSLIPSINSSNHWMSLTAIMLGFAGMELSAVHIKDVTNPKSTFPKALLLSTIIILGTMILGSLAIATVLPVNKINLVNGTIQTFAYYLSAYRLTAFTPLLTLLIVFGSIGGMISWVISPVKGFSQAAAHGFLPANLQCQNNSAAPRSLLLLQAGIVSIICLVFWFFPSINDSYWFLSVLTTQLYMMMYILLFLCAMRLCHNTTPSDYFTMPLGNVGRILIGCLGIFGCVLTIGVGFITPSNMVIAHFPLLILLGMALLISPVFAFYLYRAKPIIQNHLLRKRLPGSMVDGVL